MQEASSNIFKRVFMMTIMTGIMTSCANVAVTSAQAAYNHKGLQNNINDQYISMQATHVLNRPSFKDTNIDVATMNGEVLIAGQAPAAWQKEEAGMRIERIAGVNRVYNLIAIAAPSSSLTRMSDAWITTKVKSQIIASNDIDATHIKVVTEKGTVFLMGTLLPEEADAAVEIASNTDGVTSVVKMFSYIKITKTL